MSVKLGSHGGWENARHWTMDAADSGSIEQVQEMLGRVVGAITRRTALTDALDSLLDELADDALTALFAQEMADSGYNEDMRSESERERDDWLEWGDIQHDEAMLRRGA